MCIRDRYEIDYVRVYQKEKKIVSGKVWRDTEGNVINAHGGDVYKRQGAMSLIRRGDYPLPYGTMNRVMSAMRRLNGISRTMQFVKEASLSSKLGKSGIVRILFTYPVVTIGVKNGNL